MAKEVVETVVIKPPNLQELEFILEGTSPYVMNKFSGEAKRMMEEDQRKGQQAKSRKKREPKDFEKTYREAMHVSTDGWIGMPASAFRAAMISACRLVGFKMTLAKLSVQIVADGFDAESGDPLVKIEGDPEVHKAYVRNSNGSPDIRWRPMWRKWRARLVVRYDADQFSASDVSNLLARVGAQVGIGAGRPDSRESAGLGWGLFRLVNRAAERKVA